MEFYQFYNSHATLNSVMLFTAVITTLYMKVDLTDHLLNTKTWPGELAQGGLFTQTDSTLDCKIKHWNIYFYFFSAQKLFFSNVSGSVNTWSVLKTSANGFTYLSLERIGSTHCCVVKLQLAAIKANDKMNIAYLVTRVWQHELHCTFVLLFYVYGWTFQ